MKKIISLAMIAVFSISAIAQNLDLNSPLPVDPTIKKGVLENGMTYYLKSTEVSKGTASYYIIQNVGSVLENDDQKGLAHFLEHMAFNGTENFEGKALLNGLQEQGLIFGRDINAYTGFDETVYNINNIPTSPEHIQTGLLALRDWSNYLLLTDSEIDAERGVIKEEWRTRQSGGMRILQATLDTRFNNAKYADRLPIGTMEVVENFEYKALRDFYHDWYRTDLQAIAIIGDFDVAEMENKVLAMFSDIPAVKNPRERFTVKIDDNEELLFDIAMDKEVATSRISFSIRHDNSFENQTIADLKEALIDNMHTSMLNNRISELSQKPEANFLGAGVYYSGGMARLHKDYSLTVVPKPNKQAEAFKEVMTEVVRAYKFGFTNSEIKRSIAELTSFYENAVATKSNKKHGQIIGGIKDNYLSNETMVDIDGEAEIAKVLMSQITKEEIDNRLKELYTQKNRSVIVTGVEGNNNLDKETTLAIITGLENDPSIIAYAEEEELKSLMSGVELTAGTIVSKKLDKDTEATNYVLSNGVKVHYKYVNKEVNKVNLEAISDGGKSLIADEDLASAEFVSSLAQYSGLGEFSMNDFNKVMAGKKAQTYFAITQTEELINGESSTKDVETMLQLVNLRFTKPRFDEQSWDVLKQALSNYLIRKSSNISSIMQDSLLVTLYGYDNIQKRVMDEKFIEDVSFEKMVKVYNERFADASDFDIFIVGDVEQEKLETLLEKYIASIPTAKVEEKWLDNEAQWNANKIKKDIFIPMEDAKSSVRYAVKSDLKYSLKNKFVADALGDILQLRLTETLREQEGGTYGASSRSNMYREPKQMVYLSVNFDCNPEKADHLVGIMLGEIEKIANGEIKKEDFDKTIANFLKDRVDAKNFNRYEMALVKNKVQYSYNMNDPKNFEKIVNKIKVKDIKKMAKLLLDKGSAYQVVFKPFTSN